MSEVVRLSEGFLDYIKNEQEEDESLEDTLARLLKLEATEVEEDEDEDTGEDED